MNVERVLRMGLALTSSLALIAGLRAFMTQVVYADDVDIVISEVMFNTACESSPGGMCGDGGTSETRFEWVEIYNKGASSVDLSGWQFCDELRTSCDALTGSLPASTYWVVANNNAAPSYDLQSEFNNYGVTVDDTHTIFLDSELGNNGLTNSGDAMFLKTDQNLCGTGGNLPCVSACISWDSTNTCASIVDDINLAYLPGASGYDDTGLTSNESDGQSIVNIQGTWYQSGPGVNHVNQASPYTVNIAEGGTPSTVGLSSVWSRSGGETALILAGLALGVVGGVIALLHRRTSG